MDKKATIKHKEEPPEFTDEELAEASEAFLQTRTQIVSNRLVYGKLLIHLDPIVTNQFPYAAVNYKNIFINAYDDSRGPNYKHGRGLQNMEHRQRQALTVHELFHLIFGHLDIPTDFDPKLANIAQDATNNRIILADKEYDLLGIGEHLVLPDGENLRLFIQHEEDGEATPLDINIPNMPEMDWVAIYYELLKFKNSGGFGGGYDKLYILGSGDVDYNAKNGKDFSKEKFEFDQKVIDAFKSCKSMGYLPGEVVDYINNLLAPQITWTDKLRYLIRTYVSRRDFSMTGSLRTAHLGFVLPRLKSEDLGDVFLPIDTSSSMSNDQLRRGLSEFKGLRDTESFRLHLIQCDAKVQTTEVYECDQEPDWSKITIKGRGGTSFVPVFDYIKEQQESGIRVCLHVFFTDLMGTFPNYTPDYKTIWVTDQPDLVKTIPFGEEILVS